MIDYQKADIDRLKKEVKDKEMAYNDEFCLRKEWQTKCQELLKEKQITKSEAIKEFAEELKNCFAISGDYLDIINIIDNLVKEMTEVKNEDN